MAETAYRLGVASWPGKTDDWSYRGLLHISFLTFLELILYISLIKKKAISSQLLNIIFCCCKMLFDFANLDFDETVSEKRNKCRNRLV